jgi:subtilase family serine protease
VPSLAAGASSTGSKSVKVKAGTPEGTYFLLACSDDTKLVAESNEANNCRASATTVVVTGPDLVESALSNPPASAAAGSSFSVTDTARNQGSAAAGATFTNYYLSLNTTKGGTDVFIGGRSVPALAAGATSTATVSVTIPAGTAPNSYFVLACADSANSVIETNEKNNCRASATKVIVN